VPPAATTRLKIIARAYFTAIEGRVVRESEGHVASFGAF
jgi:hypothetical protein